MESSTPARDTARAMSQENIEIAKRFFDALTREDPLEVIDAYCTDDLDYRAAEGAIDDRGPIHGKAAMRAFVQDWLDTFDEVRWSRRC